MSFRVCQSGRVEEEAMADTVSIKKIEERPRSPSTKDAERREESKYAAGA